MAESMYCPMTQKCGRPSCERRVTADWLSGMTINELGRRLSEEAKRQGWQVVETGCLILCPEHTMGAVLDRVLDAFKTEAVAVEP